MEVYDGSGGHQARGENLFRQREEEREERRERRREGESIQYYIRMHIYMSTDEVLLRTSTTREVTLYQVASTWYYSTTTTTGGVVL